MKVNFNASNVAGGAVGGALVALAIKGIEVGVTFARVKLAERKLKKVKALEAAKPTENQEK